MLPPPPPAIVVTCVAPDDPGGGVRVVAPGPNREPRLDGSRDGSDNRDSLAAACTDAADAADSGPPRGAEWMAGLGHGWSIDLLQSSGGRRYVAATVSWGRDLMRDAGPGWLRGRLMWAVEVMPLYGQHAPSSTAGAGISPLVWRWRFTPGRRAAAFAELAFGGLLTRDAVPERTERANFLTHGAIGVRWRPAATWSLVTAYRFQHISNGNQLRSNPGVNAHVLWLGFSLRGGR